MNQIKKIFGTIAVMVAMSAPMQAQVFLDDEDIYARGNGDGNMDIGNIIPQHGIELDQANYTPVGEGILLLSVLGGAYLLGKRKKSK